MFITTNNQKKAKKSSVEILVKLAEKISPLDESIKKRKDKIALYQEVLNDKMHEGMQKMFKNMIDETKNELEKDLLTYNEQIHQWLHENITEINRQKKTNPSAFITNEIEKITSSQSKNFASLKKGFLNK